MAKRRKFIYTIWSGRRSKYYIVTPQQFEDRLAVELGDTDYCNGIGITTANYNEAKKAIRKMKQPNHGGYIFNRISFAIDSEEDFARRDQSRYEKLKEGDSVHSL